MDDVDGVFDTKDQWLKIFFRLLEFHLKSYNGELDFDVLRKASRPKVTLVINLITS